MAQEKSECVKFEDTQNAAENMTQEFELPVTYKGEEILFPAKFQFLGYTHRFLVGVYGEEIVFEPDEERNYRALLEANKLTKHLTLDLLQAIAEALAFHMK